MLNALMRKRRPEGVEAKANVASSCWRPARHVMMASGEGRTFLLDTKGERYMGLDDVGAAVWAGLQAGEAPAAIVARLIDEYDAAPDTVRGDVEDFLAQLAARGLIEVA